MLEVREMLGPTLSSAGFQKSWAAAATTTTTITTEHIIYQRTTPYQIPSTPGTVQNGEVGAERRQHAVPQK